MRAGLLGHHGRRWCAEDRYERELVLTTSSVGCQAKTADLLLPGTRMTGSGLDPERGPRSRDTRALSSAPGTGCRPAGPGSTSRQGRASAPLRRAPLPGPRSGLPVRSLFVGIVSIRSWAAIVQRLGCPASQPLRRDCQVFPGQCVRSGSLFRLADIFMSASRPGGYPGPVALGARAEGRLSTAVCGHGGGRKAGPEPLCMNAPGRACSIGPQTHPRPTRRSPIARR